MVQEVEGLEEPGVVWGGGRGGGGGGGGRVEVLGQELKRLQRKVRNTLDDWLEFYRAATGTVATSRNLWRFTLLPVLCFMAFMQSPKDKQVHDMRTALQ